MYRVPRYLLTIKYKMASPQAVNYDSRLLCVERFAYKSEITERISMHLSLVGKKLLNKGKLAVRVCYTSRIILDISALDAYMSTLLQLYIFPMFI